MRMTALAVSGLAALALASHGAAQQTAPRPAAVVEGTAITMAEVESVLKQSGPSATPLTDAQRRMMQREAVDLLINDLLFTQLMRRIAPRVEVADVERRLGEFAEGLKKEGKTLPDYYRESGKNEAQLRSDIVTLLQKEAYVREHFAEADVKKYYDENRDFFDRVTVRASHILLRIASTAPAAEQQAVRARLERIRQDVLAGKIDFAEAAKAFSQDTTAASGGDVGYFPRKFVVDENYARSAYALKVGDISPIVQTEFGMYLIKVTDRKPGTPQDFNQIKDTVRTLCAEETLMNMLAQYRKSAKIEIYLP